LPWLMLPLPPLFDVEFFSDDDLKRFLSNNNLSISKRFISKKCARCCDYLAMYMKNIYICAISIYVL
jgi:hypothetical protein